MKKVLKTLAIVLLCVLAVPTMPAKAAARLNQTKVVTYVGDHSNVYMRGTNRHVTWTTSNSRVATVKDGRITAKKNGNAVITAKVGNKKYTCKVTVKKAEEKTVVIRVDKKLVKNPLMKEAAKKLVVKKQRTQGKYVYYTVTKKSYQKVQKNLKNELNYVNDAVVENGPDVKKITYNSSATKIKLYVDMSKVSSLDEWMEAIGTDLAEIQGKMSCIQAFNGVSSSKIRNKIVIYDARTNHVVKRIVKNNALV